MRRAKWRQCSGKKKQRRHDAESTARNLALLGRPVEAYQCPHCGTWHVGHTDGSIDRTLVIEEREMYDGIADNTGARARRLHRRR